MAADRESGPPLASLGYQALSLGVQEIGPADQPSAGAFGAFLHVPPASFINSIFPGLGHSLPIHPPRLLPGTFLDPGGLKPTCWSCGPGGWKDAEAWVCPTAPHPRQPGVRSFPSWAMVGTKSTPQGDPNLGRPGGGPSSSDELSRSE